MDILGCVLKLVFLKTASANKKRMQIKPKKPKDSCLQKVFTWPSLKPRLQFEHRLFLHSETIEFSNHPGLQVRTAVRLREGIPIVSVKADTFHNTILYTIIIHSTSENTVSYSTFIILEFNAREKNTSFQDMRCSNMYFCTNSNLHILLDGQSINMDE